MAETYSLDVQPRHIVGKQVRQLRRSNLIPAVVYGAGEAPINIACPRRPLEILLSRAGGTHLVTLNVDGKTENVLVREVQRHIVRRDLIHIDFMRVDLKKKLRTEVNLRLIGEPKLGTDLTLAHYMTQIEVECLPTDIPDHIEVNLAGLTAAGDQVTVANLPTFENVVYLAEPSDVIVRLETASAATAEDLAAEAATVAEPEIASTKGKKEDEGEEA